MNPPLVRGHPELASLFTALEAEYALRKGPVVGEWLRNTGRPLAFRHQDQYGIGVQDFYTWVDNVQLVIRRNGVSTLEDIKFVWVDGGAYRSIPDCGCGRTGMSRFSGTRKIDSNTYITRYTQGDVMYIECRRVL